MANGGNDQPERPVLCAHVHRLRQDALLFWSRRYISRGRWRRWESRPVEARRWKCSERSLRFYLCALQATLGDDERKDGQFLLLEADGQMESLGQQRLHHQSHLLVEIVVR